MIDLTFTEAARKELDYQRYHHPHPRVQQRMEVVRLKAHGVPHQQIAVYAGVSENTVRRYLRLYQAGGIEALQSLNWQGLTSDLAAHRSTLAAYFQDHPPTTLAHAAAEIERLTHLKRSETQVGIFLKHLGLMHRKTSAVPAKGDAAPQATFKKKSWNPA